MPEQLNLIGESIVTLSELPVVAHQLLKAGKDLSVWFLHGEMGAGKTTLARKILEQAGVDSNVASPTFSIVNEYENADGKIIYHFDLYRLKNETEALDIGMEEYLSSGHLCLIEWPEKIKSLWPTTYFEIFIEHHSETSRKIHYRRHD
jgi:tRNA threonylcarbamoyladenosine biosynthesis protein TsaE